MKKGMFDIIPDIQDDILKKSQSIKEMNKLIDSYGYNRAYMLDPKTNEVVSLKECMASTINRYKIYVTKLLKYAPTEKHKFRLTHKLEELNEFYENKKTEEDKIKAEKEKAAKKEYWRKKNEEAKKNGTYVPYKKSIVEQKPVIEKLKQIEPTPIIIPEIIIPEPQISEKIVLSENDDAIVVVRESIMSNTDIYCESTKHIEKEMKTKKHNKPKRGHFEKDEYDEYYDY